MKLRIALYVLVVLAGSFALAHAVFLSAVDG